METRRTSKIVIDPKIRQVGFFTGTETSLPNRTQSVPIDSTGSGNNNSPPISNISPSNNSLSPVMIPPPRHVSIPVPTPLSPLRKFVAIDRQNNNNNNANMIHGSYNPSFDSFSSVMSPRGSSSKVDEGEFWENMSSPGLGLNRKGKFGKIASSLPSGGFESTGFVKERSFVGASNLTTVSVMKMPPGVSEKAGGGLIEVQNERSPSSKPVQAKPSKAERRALQESQRAAKAAARAEGSKGGASSGGVALGNPKPAKSVKPPLEKKDASHAAASVAASEKKGSDRALEKDRKKDVPHPRMQFDDKHRVEKAKKRGFVKQTEARNRVELFRHLPQYEHGTQLPDLEAKFYQFDPMHPSVYKVGLRYLVGDVSGGNARCIAMLHAFKDAISDYTTPSEKVLIMDLPAKISSYISFLNECRPISISMGNAIRFLKSRIRRLPITVSESEAKATLQSDIDRFINEKIITADKVIVEHAVTKISDGDVLLTYGSPAVVEMLLLYAHKLGKKFRVVIVDSRPKLEGQGLLRRLMANGLSCTYTHINAISYIMHEVTRVFLGAASILSNGTVYSRVGTASVAMVANAFRVPVLICCEAYKFHERVQLDSICSNELGMLALHIFTSYWASCSCTLDSVLAPFSSLFFFLFHR
ncbi:hypothetical protein AQUCO_02600215v1 [Aquilegia coerulea]|uniref:Translation initiation factor eIF2B subunit delta n=1 Tax=Aquilegia coerulea TaxID=218851 RepID=A0A2G5D8R8_AQUCA|nr:hypothetical protein AQUCO_02600215v1 [Aquilegia coerulea]